MIMLLLTALFASYLLQQKKVEAVHETVISIFAGMEIFQWMTRLAQVNSMQE